ncbi:hypothetical protein SUGI_1199960 [Cryptomeria japonica]|nr:hypothetical protein SUGI_1199960 [Cryptomeria japonica]
MRAEDRDFALKCANRCSFKKDDYILSSGFHPIALKFLGQNLFSKCGSNLSKWVYELDGLDGMFAVLGKVFDEMDPKYRSIFMLLTVYMLPNLSPHKVTEWLAIKCNEDIKFIEKAVEDLCKNGFIEEIEPEIRIHDLLKEFAEIKANECDVAGKVVIPDLNVFLYGLNII